MTRGGLGALVLALATHLADPAVADPAMQLDPSWEFVADTVMGGVSSGWIEAVTLDGQTATRLAGTVSLENDGGFVQMAADLPADLGAGAYDGVRIVLRGNGEAYDVRLRTTALTRPWQSFRTTVTVPGTWTVFDLPWTAFAAHRTDATLDPDQIRRIGILAVGREMVADVAVSGVGLYRVAGN